jgi:Holliday junction DNA helicase RuvA
MIGRLKGVVLTKQPPTLLVDVHGVGYEVEAPMSTFYQLPEVGREVTLVTHLTVRDDSYALYGFISEAERSLFRHLLRVSGVGPKLGLAILSAITPDDFLRSIHHGDTSALTRLPGVGKKTAERLILEMRDRLEQSIPGPSHPDTGDGDSPFSFAASASEEAVHALVTLGYKTAEAERMIRQVAAPGLGTEEMIRKALQSAVRN